MPPVETGELQAVAAVGAYTGRPGCEQAPGADLDRLARGRRRAGWFAAGWRGEGWCRAIPCQRLGFSRWLVSTAWRDGRSAPWASAGQVDAAEVETGQRQQAAQVGLEGVFLFITSFLRGLQAAAGDDRIVVDVVGGLVAAPSKARSCFGRPHRTLPSGRASKPYAGRGSSQVMPVRCGCPSWQPNQMNRPNTGQ